MRYQDYLKSAEWKNLARNARVRAGNRCEMCGDSPDHVHHVRYPKSFKDDGLENLIVLCASCHAKSHGIRGEVMQTGKTITVSGYRICATTSSDGVPLVRFKDVMLAFGHQDHRIDQALWSRVKNTIIEGPHWVRLENPFTQKLECFLTISGTGVVAATECRNHEVAKEIVHQMAAAWEREKLGMVKRDAPKTTAEVLLETIQYVVDIERQQREIKSQQRAHEARIEALERERIKGLEFVSAAAAMEAATARQGLLLRGLNPEADYNGSPLKVVIGRIAKSLCREKGIQPKQIIEGTYRVNVYPMHILDDAIRSLGLLH